MSWKSDDNDLAPPYTVMEHQDICSVLCENKTLTRANEDLRERLDLLMQKVRHVSNENTSMWNRNSESMIDYKSLKDGFHDLLFNGLHEKCRRFPQIILKREECSLEDYIFGDEVIDSRAGRSVLSAVKRRNGERVVVKVWEKRMIRRFRQLELIDEEMKTLRKLQHPSIVQLIDAWETPALLNVAYERFGKDLYYVMEPYNSKMPDSLIRQITTPLVDVLQYIHGQNIAHLDIKPENILVLMNGAESKCSVKLTDFELAVEVDADDYSFFQGPRGSDGFMAPEMFAKGGYNPMKCDVWSLGCVLHELVVGHENFNDRWMVYYSQLMTRKTYSVDDFIEDLRFAVEITSEEIRDSPFRELLISTLEISPHLRLNAAELLHHDPTVSKAVNGTKLPRTRIVNSLRVRVDISLDDEVDDDDDEVIFRPSDTETGRRRRRLNEDNETGCGLSLLSPLSPPMGSKPADKLARRRRLEDCMIVG
eukprot:CAMPEP_0185753446 /NCGR_PEP_ID=MMETSP1174-20130828/12180_1 /TAXON_ID=35687 /ORGANISM="Dictyocha speculum, Strain CCMP1381" /LENGTH=478 /DNA_ID=CAMNT_0028431301 /DNA_START=31 /DNA_END=1467 /DNA_ORIENTATION=-